VQSAQRITRGTQPALQDIISTQCHRKAKKIIKYLSHPSQVLFTLLPSRWRQYRCFKAGTKRLRSSFSGHQSRALSLLFLPLSLYFDLSLYSKVPYSHKKA
jgi:hypothetical protein